MPGYKSNSDVGLGATWTSYNYPATIASGSETASFSYNQDRQRWKMVFNPGTPETTYYIGGLLEKVIVGANVDYRHYIQGGNDVVAIYSRTSSTNTLRYVLEDNQGSVDAIADTSGNTLVNESFTPFGVRRNAATWNGAATNGPALDAITRQGYTFQTVLGNMGLNHMNGRVQDAITGRFLSADPYITRPSYTQNYNRYSYVYNNPMSFTDPSGFEDAPNPARIRATGAVRRPRVLLPDPNADMQTVFVYGWVPTGWDEGAGGPAEDGGRQGPCGHVFGGVLSAQACEVKNSMTGLGRAQYDAEAEKHGPKVEDPTNTGPQGEPHRYEIKRDTQCSAPKAWELIKRAGFSAPGAPQAAEDLTPEVELLGPNRISQFVDSNTMTITNTTLEGHEFYPGTVVIQVQPNSSGSTITVVGTGTSPTPNLNNFAGWLIFGNVVNTVQWMCNPQASTIPRF